MSTAMRVSFCMGGLLLAFTQPRLWHIDADRVVGGVHPITEADEAGLRVLEPRRLSTMKRVSERGQVGR